MTEFWSILRELSTESFSNFSGSNLPTPVGIDYQGQETFHQWWPDIPQVGIQVPASEEELARLVVVWDNFASIIGRGQSASGLDRELWILLNDITPTPLIKVTRDKLLTQIAQTHYICHHLLSAKDVLEFARGGEGRALDDLAAIKHQLSEFFPKESEN